MIVYRGATVGKVKILLRESKFFAYALISFNLARVEKTSLPDIDSALDTIDVVVLSTSG